MIKISNILDVEKHLDGIDAVVFDLDDTLYAERDYVRSGFLATAPDKFEELWQAFLAGKPAFDTVVPEQKEQALRVYREHMPDIALFPGVREMLVRIRRSGRKLGMITDGRPEGQRAKITALQLWDMFDEIIITDELGGIEFRKPNPRAFELMQQKIRIPFERMCYVGDNAKKDFIAPNHLGIQTIYYENKNGFYCQEV